MQSGHAANPGPVLAAGVGVSYGCGWALRSASFRLGTPEHGAASLEPGRPGGTALGILIGERAVAATVLDLLSGRVPPGYGTLIVLGEDMSTSRGRAAVRRRVGIARGGSVWPLPGRRVRGMVEHAARRAMQPGQDRNLLVAAILDRLALAPWSDVPIRSAPELIIRKARLAAAAVHQPSLLLLDGILDELPPLELTIVADVIAELNRDTALIITGADADPLRAACAQVLTLTGGILIGSPAPAVQQPGEPGEPGAPADDESPLAAWRD